MFRACGRHRLILVRELEAFGGGGEMSADAAMATASFLHYGASPSSRRREAPWLRSWWVSGLAHAGGMQSGRRLLGHPPVMGLPS